MPIPSIEQVSNCSSLEELDELYKTEPYRWVRGVFRWNFVEFNSNLRAWTIIAYECDTDRLQECGCGERVKQYIRLYPSGMILTCAKCRCTGGPLSDEAFVVVNRRRATLRECWDTIHRTGQFPPFALPKMGTDHLGNIP